MDRGVVEQIGQDDVEQDGVDEDGGQRVRDVDLERSFVESGS
jgi:hypothetical protein